MLVKVNGVELYYEKCGNGRPLILLHGNGEDHTVFDSFLPYVSERFTVYALDSRSHGKSSRARLGYREMAEDVERFIEVLGLEEPAVVGFSDGGIIALMLAAAERARLKAVVALGANAAPCGIKPFWLNLFRIGYFFTRSGYLKLMIKEPDISDEELASIGVPTLLTVGEKDMIYPAHVARTAALIPGAEFYEVAGEGHISYVTAGKKLYSVIGDFLERRAI